MKKLFVMMLCLLLTTALALPAFASSPKVILTADSRFSTGKKITVDIEAMADMDERIETALKKGKVKYQWFSGSDPIAGANAVSYTPTAKVKTLKVQVTCGDLVLTSSGYIITGIIVVTTRNTVPTTKKPTTAPTTVITTEATTVPTTAPTTAPTTEATTIPTTAETTVPTTAPTAAPTEAATTVPVATEPMAEPVAIAQPASAPLAEPVEQAPAADIPEPMQLSGSASKHAPGQTFRWWKEALIAFAVVLIVGTAVTLRRKKI